MSLTGLFPGPAVPRCGEPWSCRISICINPPIHPPLISPLLPRVIRPSYPSLSIDDRYPSVALHAGEPCCGPIWRGPTVGRRPMFLKGPIAGSGAPAIPHVLALPAGQKLPGPEWVQEEACLGGPVVLGNRENFFQLTTTRVACHERQGRRVGEGGGGRRGRTEGGMMNSGGSRKEKARGREGEHFHQHGMFKLSDRGMRSSLFLRGSVFKAMLHSPTTLLRRHVRYQSTDPRLIIQMRL